MTAVAFALTALENGRRVGHAVICAEARYVRVQHAGADRPERRFVRAQEWQALDRAVSETLEPGPLPADGAISSALLPPDKRRSTVVQYLYAQPVVDGPDVAVRLDALLHGLTAPALGMDRQG
jgi:hypothetical protein